MGASIQTRNRRSFQAFWNNVSSHENSNPWRDQQRYFLPVPFFIFSLDQILGISAHSGAHCDYWDSSGPRRLRNLWKRYCGYAGLNTNLKWSFQWDYSPLTHCFSTQARVANPGTTLSGVTISVSWMFANYVKKGYLSVGTGCYSLIGVTRVTKRH